MFTKGLPLGKRPIYIWVQITCVSFLFDSEKISQTTIGAWTDTSLVFFGRYQSVWIKWRSRLDCANDSPMLQMMRKNEAPYRLSGLIWTLLKTENHWKSDITCCLPKNDSRGRLTLKTKTSVKQAEKETECKCLRQNPPKTNKTKKAKKEAEPKSLWQN